MFKSLGINTKMTGCITLFIKNPFTGMPRLNHIYLVEVPAVITNALPAHISNKSIIMPQNYRNKHGLNKYIHAYNIIERYARLVITTRIHCAPPCVALETPVIFLNLKSINGASRKHPSPRVSGLLDLFHHIDFYKTSMQHAHVFLQNFNYSEPPPNPN